VISKGKQFGSCKLCGQEAKRCQSHIVPEFCYEYDAKHRALALNLPEDAPPAKQTIQKGHREYLFCSSCEQILCRYEKAFSEFWYSPDGLGKTIDKDCIAVVLKAADYKSIKLFLLSVIWRANLSELFGKNIGLGPYSEKLRDIIFNGKYVPTNQYPILGRVITDANGNVLRSIIADPVCTRHDHIRRYSMCFAGCEWNILMSDHGVPKQFEPLYNAFNEDGKIHLITGKYWSIPAVKQIVERIKR
jgi:hypothetical protein